LSAARCSSNTVNDNDEITGVIEHSRVFAHHAMFRVVHLFLFNHNNELLLQQLSPQRERHPAAWGSSVAGYVLAGETYEQAATRRVQQELGVTCDLHHFGKTTMIDEGCKKFITLFLATCAVTHLFRAWRWEFLLRPVGVMLPLSRLLPISSVGFMAMLRTRPSPKCCCASQMISMGLGTSKPSLVMRMAVWTSGIKPSGNSQSTAGPATCTTLPMTAAVVDVAINSMTPILR